MARFTVTLTTEAQKDILALNTTVQSRILDKLEWIGANAELIRHQPLKGEQWEGLFKYRVGNYRILYQFNVATKQLIILKVGHRREVYKP